MGRLKIDLGGRSYTITIGGGLLSSLPSCLDAKRTWVIITDEVVYSLYGRELVADWVGARVHVIVLPLGEGTKSLQTVEEILIKMLDLGITRNDSILALGGGVVGDVAGFCASIYMRGISYVQVPTTLLAQVDSSVGGKTGVNLPGGKNLAGSFYQPQGVFIDTDTLCTLPTRHLISGMAEVIKYGVIYDYAFLGYLCDNFAAILSLEESSIKQVITRCCQIKAEVVGDDEREEGRRKNLNYGHTIGHALETATGYKQYTHGEAVLIGMYLEACMSRKLGLIDQAYCDEIKRLIRKTKVDLRIEDSVYKALTDAMVRDKKNKNGRISFILPSNKEETTEVLMSKDEVQNILEIL